MSTRAATDDTRVDSSRIGPDDPRYRAVVDKRFNKRFRANPEYVRLVSSTDQVASAVDEAVRAGLRLVVTRETSDPDRDLWWAHTGGGAGNFGVVTRYWFRAPDAAADDPTTLLPRAPESITTFTAAWNWSEIDEPRFLRLVRNHGM